MISVTWALPPDTRVTLPASPPAAITGWSTRTPSPRPLSILIVEYQTVGERAITRAATGLVPSGKPSVRRRPTRPRSWSASRRAVSRAASSLRRPATSSRSFSLSPLASKVSPTQPTRSRTGFSARLAPFSIGETTSWAPSWIAPRGPPPPKEIVISTMAAATKATSTARRRRIVLRSNICPGNLPEGPARLAAPVVSGLLVGAVDRLELLEAAARAHRDAGQR